MALLQERPYFFKEPTDGSHPIADDALHTLQHTATHCVSVLHQSISDFFHLFIFCSLSHIHAHTRMCVCACGILNQTVTRFLILGLHLNLYRVLPRPCYHAHITHQQGAAVVENEFDSMQVALYAALKQSAHWPTLEIWTAQ